MYIKTTTILNNISYDLSFGLNGDYIWMEKTIDFDFYKKSLGFINMDNINQLGNNHIQNFLNNINGLEEFNNIEKKTILQLFNNMFDKIHDFIKQNNCNINNVYIID